MLRSVLKSVRPSLVPSIFEHGALRNYRRYRYRPPQRFNQAYDPYTIINSNQSYDSISDLNKQQGSNQQREYTKEEYEEAERAQRIYNRWGRLAFFYVYRRPIYWTLGAIGLVYVTHLERVPDSGRWRFMLVPRWLEMQLGEQTYEQTLSEMRPYLLPDSHPKTVMVKRIMNRIIAAAQMQDLDWRVHVVRGQFPPNAFVIPGGKVFVFDSLLPVCKNTDGLATVLSHETAHQVCRHSAESISKAPVHWLINIAFLIATGVYFSNNPLTNLALTLPSSREMEREADTVGLDLMAKACFDPNEAPRLWQRMMQMEKSQGANVPEFLSTHPTSANRIELIEERLPEANRIRAENCQNMTDFRRLF